MLTLQGSEKNQLRCCVQRTQHNMPTFDTWYAFLSREPELSTVQIWRCWDWLGLDPTAVLGLGTGSTPPGRPEPKTSHLRTLGAP